MKPMVVAILLAVVAGAAFLVGRSLAEGGAGAGAAGGEGPATERELALESQVEDLKSRLAEERSRRARGGDGGRARIAEAEASDALPAPPPNDLAGAAADAAAAPVDPAAPFTLEGVSSAREASQRFMDFVEAQLGRGDAGFAAILDAVAAVWKDKQAIESLFSDEAAAARELYPWIKLMVQREPQMLDLNEYVFKTMAEKPQQFASFTDDNALEIFTEGFAFVLPGAIPEDRMARMRGYAKKILATPEGDQPKAVRGNRSEIERLLSRFWMEPITPEQALAKLRSGDVEPRELVRFLRMLPPDVAATLDVTALAAAQVRDGSWEVVRLLGTPPLDKLDVARLDAAALEALDASKMQGHMVGQYLQRTGRSNWADARAFVDRAAGQGERTQTAIVQALAFGMPQHLRPDKAYVEDLLTRVTVNDALKQQIRNNYGIK